MQKSKSQKLKNLAIESKCVNELPRKKSTPSLPPNILRGPRKAKMTFEKQKIKKSENKKSYKMNEQLKIAK